MAPQQLTVVTRQLDLLVVEKVWWRGALDEVNFLERLYDLDALEGDGYRLLTAREDIWQHCTNNDGWSPEWVFTDTRFGLKGDCPQPLLNFLAEMLHPVVRRDPAEVQRLAEKLNDILAKDSFGLYPAEYISELPVYAGGTRASFHGAQPDLKFEARPLLADPRVLHEHQERIRGGLERDSAAAMHPAKNSSKVSARSSWNQGIEYPPGEDLPPLFKRVTTLLGLNADAVADHAKALAASGRTAGTTVRNRRAAPTPRLRVMLDRVHQVQQRRVLEGEVHIGADYDVQTLRERLAGPPVRPFERHGQPLEAGVRGPAGGGRTLVRAAGVGDRGGAAAG
ncbi:hypothetical protein [Streptomyces collinus]|uniref:AbiJ-related protein n=1 Tax=Streptomyces collinus TaxID=42684 RepID=UPI0033186420